MGFGFEYPCSLFVHPTVGVGLGFYRGSPDDVKTKKDAKSVYPNVHVLTIPGKSANPALICLV